MSDIAQKTLPPGSWPAKGGGGKGTPASEDVANSEAAAPRSVVSHTQDRASNPAGVLRRPASRGGNADEEDVYPEGHYTTASSNNNNVNDGEVQKDGLAEIPEASDSNRMTSNEGVRSLDELDPEPMADGEEALHGGPGMTNDGHPTPRQQQQQHANGGVAEEEELEQPGGVHAEDHAVPTGKTEMPASDTARPPDAAASQLGGDNEAPGAAASQPGGDNEAPGAADVARGEVVEGQEQQEQQAAPSTTLTDRAKRLFDLASENQPTTEARDSFLQTARSGVSGSKASQPEQQQPEVEGAPTAAATEEAGVEAQLPEGQSAAEVGEEGAEAPAGADWQTAPSQLGSQQQPQEGAEAQQPHITPSQLGSDVPTEVREQMLQEQQQPHITPSQLGSDVPTDVREQMLQEQQQQAQPSEAGTAAAGAAATAQDEQTPGSQAPDADEVNTFQPAQTIPSTEMQDQLAADFSVLRNGRVNKGGNVVAEDGRVVGRVTQGALQYLIGRTVDEEGNIWSPSGKVIGRAEPLSEDERDELVKEPAPFESFPGATVNGDGYVVADNGEIVGKVVAGDLQVLRGKEVDPDGEIMDRAGNVIGRAERWEPEPEEEPEQVDQSILAGKRVNKAGNVVDGSGTIFGRVVEGDVRAMVGRMCDRLGNVLSEGGDVIGRAEVVPEGEREGLKEGPFAELEGCTVAKDGTVVTPAGDVVGRLVSGDAKVLFGRAVDEDGDVLDRNGNVLGRAERWQPEEVERKKNPMSGRRVNRQGEVVDEDGNIIGKLTSGNLQVCSGKEIDDDGDVVDSKGTVIGHCSLLDDIPAEEPETESAEEALKREQLEADRKLAAQMTVCISQCLDRIRPICKMITEKIDRAERVPADERDDEFEEALVREVRPLIEEGGRILTEAQGIIKGLDPDGRISANAKHKTAAREATPEEYRLADALKDLTGDVTQCIENAKRKLEDMPHAKKELNPLWGLLNEPLFQILAAVGLLLNGVLSLVGRLLSGLGLGGLLDGLLGTLGLNRVLEGLGLGQVTKSLSGGGGKKKSGGGLLSGLLGGK